jgi:beta-galactosidase/beta-glucuronidase
MFQTRSLRVAIAGSLGILAWLVPGVPDAQPSTRIDLNGEWHFRTDPAQQGEQQGWNANRPGETVTVRVPHTWNIGKYEDFEGTAWYFKTFELSEELRSKHVELHFGAIFYKSRVWMNGKELGGHEGGHTEFWFDVTPHLKRENFLAVEINNQPTVQSIPGWAMKLHSSKNLWYDWWHYGGIVRDVWLSINDPALIRRQQIRVRIQGKVATVTDRVFLEMGHGTPIRAKLVVEALPPEGGPAAATAETALTLGPGAHDSELTLQIESPKIWHFDLPRVYQMEARLLDSRGEELDSIADSFGIRSVEIRDRRLYLNDEPVRLTGMARHEESPWEGLAETRGTMQHDYDDMKALQMTLTRPVHYPQHKYILDYCDRNGILVIPEIPMWQFNEKQMKDPKVIELAQGMMREMIEQDYNHPSIFAWSVCNESATNTPGGKAYFKAMRDFVKSLDPDRFVTFADDQIAFTANPQDNASSLADFIMWNEYFGAWHGPTSLLPGVLERIEKNYPDKMVVISEFGTPGPFAPTSEAADKLRAKIFREQLELIGKRPWIAGALMWCYQDYRSHRNLWPGQTAGVVDHGVVDENRQRRPSYFVWRELNSPALIRLEWRLNGDEKPVGFRAAIERRRPDEIPSYTLRHYRVEWEARDNDNNQVASGKQDLPDIGPPQSLDANWPSPQTKSLHLRLRLDRSTGFVAAEKTLDWWEPRTGGLNIDEMRREGLPLPE